MDSGLIDDFIVEASESLEPTQKVLNQKDGVTVVVKKVPGIEHDMIKAWGVVSAPAHCCYRALSDLEERRSWDNTSDELSAVDQLDRNTTVYYTLVQGIFGMQPRDFVDLRHTVVLPNGNHLVVFVATEHEDCPEKPGVVRGQTILSGQLIQPIDPDSCMLTVVTQVDIKGSIPVYLVNKVAARSPIEWFHSLRVHLNQCVHLPAVSTAPSDLEHLISKLRRCNRQQLIGVVRSLTESKPSLVPVITAGVAAAMAKRAETEYMIRYTYEALERFDRVSVEALTTAEETPKHMDCSALVESANNHTEAILADILHVLGQSSTGYKPVELSLVIELNAALRLQVNTYSEAIYTQALKKAAQFEEDFNQKSGLRPADNISYGARLSRWWYGEQQEPPVEMQLPQVSSSRRRSSSAGIPPMGAAMMGAVPGPSLSADSASMVDVPGDVHEEFDLSSLANVMGIAQLLSHKLELTSVKKLLRLPKYRSFSFDELIQVSNGHIAHTQDQIDKICQQIDEWEAAKHVFAVCKSNAQLARKLNDYSEVINKDMRHQSPINCSSANPAPL